MTMTAADKRHAMLVLAVQSASKDEPPERVVMRARAYEDYVEQPAPAKEAARAVGGYDMMPGSPGSMEWKL